jgi:hypothetical protein
MSAIQSGISIIFKILIGLNRDLIMHNSKMSALKESDGKIPNGVTVHGTK